MHYTTNVKVYLDETQGSTYTFQSESTLYSGLNIKEPLAQNRRDIWNK